MALYDYTDALKQGRKKYQEALLTGKHPYLPVLDDILSYTEIVSEVNLGVMDVPLSKIIGTKTAGRTNAFANNFMPLLPEKSEFAAKWANLYDHQVNEGLRDLDGPEVQNIQPPQLLITFDVRLEVKAVQILREVD